MCPDGITGRRPILKHSDMIHHARTVDEMLDLGSHAAQQAASGSIWLLSGDLGAGKTHWTKGFVKGIGSASEVTSPTFGLVHEYPGGRFTVYHFDFYRLKSMEELLSLGWDEYLESGGIVLAEWGERFPDAFPSGINRVHISTAEDGCRIVEQLKG